MRDILNSDVEYLLDKADSEFYIGRSNVNPYVYDIRQPAMRIRDRYREWNRLGRCSWWSYPDILSEQREKELNRQYPSSIFTNLGLITVEMGFPCRSWGLRF